MQSSLVSWDIESRSPLALPHLPKSEDAQALSRVE
jgi:hypothetical protein